MKKPICILLIDDNDADNEYHKIMIDEAGIPSVVNVLHTGIEALEYLEHSNDSEECNTPDLIFLDINMPAMNGFEFLQKCREKGIFKGHKPIIIIMLTSSLNPSDQQMALESFKNEIQGYMNKPLTSESLKAIVKKYFENGTLSNLATDSSAGNDPKSSDSPVTQ